jgi:aryl-alcohol dehydrogenase-like predicted oxidoreductase
MRNNTSPKGNHPSAIGMKKNLKPFATPKLVFGTAQLGGNYGIANTTGQPTPKECREMIETAIANGVVYLDTARVYGNSEEMIGQALKNGWKDRVKVITKLSPLDDVPRDATNSTLRTRVDASVFQSRTLLGVQKIDVLMLHRASHLFLCDGGVWQRLLELQASGVIGALGTSVQTPEELLQTLAIPEISFVQLPANILDWRWDAVVPNILATKASRNLTVHVRSALLQGLLPSVNEEHWRRANVENAASVRDWLLNRAAACQRANVADICLSYVNALAWADGITTGMENMGQLIENIEYLNHPPLRADQVTAIRNTRPKLSEATLNPALWKKNHQ